MCPPSQQEDRCRARVHAETGYCGRYRVHAEALSSLLEPYALSARAAALAKWERGPDLLGDADGLLAT